MKHSRRMRAAVAIAGVSMLVCSGVTPAFATGEKSYDQIVEGGAEHLY